MAALAVVSANLGAPPVSATTNCIEMGTAWVCVILDPTSVPSPTVLRRCDPGVSLLFAGTDVSVCITSSAGGGPLVEPPAIGMPDVSGPAAPRSDPCREGHGLQFAGGVLLGHVCLLVYYGPPEGAPSIDPRTCSTWIDGDVQGDRMILCPRLAADPQVPTAVDVAPPTLGPPDGPGDPGASACPDGFGAGATLGGRHWTACADAVVDIQPLGEIDTVVCDPGEVGLVLRVGEGELGVCADL